VFTGRQKKKCHKAPNMSEVIHRTEEQETGLSSALRIRRIERTVLPNTPVPLKELGLVSLFLVILRMYKITFQLKET